MSTHAFRLQNTIKTYPGFQEIAAVIQDERRTVLFSSHISQDIEQIADYVAIVNDGKLCEYQDKESLLERYRQVSGAFSGDESLLSAHLRNVRYVATSFVGTTD